MSEMQVFPADYWEAAMFNIHQTTCRGWVLLLRGRGIRGGCSCCGLGGSGGDPGDPEWTASVQCGIFHPQLFWSRLETWRGRGHCHGSDGKMPVGLVWGIGNMLLGGKIPPYRRRWIIFSTS